MSSEDATEAATHLIALSEEKQAILALLEEEFPEEMERLQSLQKEIDTAVSTVKTALRQSGHGKTLFGHEFKVGSGAKKLNVDEAGVLDRAEEEGHLMILIDAGFVKYAFDPKQVDRLPGKLKAIYTEFVEEEEGTKRVYIPKELL